MNASRRASPRIWQADWYVLRGLGRAIADLSRDVDLAGKRVLDVGCGARPYEAWFTRAGARYRGADVDGRHEVAIDESGRLDAENASVDLVTSFQVLEHVWDVPAYLGEAHRVLAPNGQLLLSTHGSWLYHPHPGDYRRWTREGLRREVEACGFQLVTMLPVAGPLACTTVLRSVGLGHLLQKIPVAGGVLAGAAAAPLNLKAWLEDALTPQSMVRDNACIYVALFDRIARA